MRIEVFRGPSDDPIATHNVTQLSMPDFRGWTDPNRVEIPLMELLTAIEELEPADEEFRMINLPIDLYLPSSVRDQLLQQAEDEQLLQPPIPLSDAIRAIAQAILCYHQPNEEYSVRITE